MTRTCIRALHFAALLDAGIDLPQALPLPFEPLLVMFERGDFRVEGSGLIDVDTLGIRVGTVDENLLPEPIRPTRRGRTGRTRSRSAERA